VKHIYVSPHADDVALSCGGQILSGSTPMNDAMVLNIFTSESGDSPQDKLFDSINSERSIEDRAAWKQIGIKADYIDLPEALLRKKFPFSILPRGDEDAIIEELYQAILPYARSNPDAAFYFPAGFGNHVDHLACRKVAFRLIDEGIIDTVILYEDTPYSWLKFIRDQHYRALLKSVEFDGDGLGKAFRQDGENILDYLRRSAVPFPRGKKLFAIVYASLFLGNLLRRRSSRPKPYHGKINVVGLDADVTVKKRDLLYNYKSQIPMLFGKNPEELLDRKYGPFSKEVTIEISKKPSVSA
jgi:hypothetical protein